MDSGQFNAWAGRSALPARQPFADGPQVTVVIPTRDRWPTVTRAVACAVHQQGVDVEVIVVDDGSRDQTVAGLAQINDERLRVLHLPDSEGGAHARNVGIKEARGSWVAFLDDDDVWSPHKLRLQLEMAHAVKAGFVYARAVHVRYPGVVARVAPLPPPGSLVQRLLVGNEIPAGASNIVVRTDLARELGGFDERLDHLTDWDFWIRLAHASSAGACDEVLVGYVDHAQNRYKHAGDVVGTEFEYLVDKHRAASEAAGVRFDRARFARGTALGHLRVGRRVTASQVYLRSALTDRSLGNATRAAGALLGEAFRDRVARDTRARPTCELDWLAGVWDSEEVLRLSGRQPGGVRSETQNLTYW
jgi:glycosyltransferase involved in cell wall biosynthesis